MQLVYVDKSIAARTYRYENRPGIRKLLGFVAPLLLVEKFDINLSDIFSIGILKFVFVCVAMSSVCNAATRTNKLCNFADVRSERPDIVAVV